MHRLQCLMMAIYKDFVLELFSKMSVKDEIAMYEQSLVNVDMMMDSVLKRVTELVAANCK